MKTLPATSVETLAPARAVLPADSRNSGVVPPWLLPARNPGIVPPWLQGRPLSPTRPLVPATSFDSNPVPTNF